MLTLTLNYTQDEERPNGEIGIKFSGLRPGEKLYEELLIGENALTTDHPRIMRAEEETLPWSEIESLLKQFEQACRNSDAHQVRELQLKAVNGFNPQCGVEDVLWKHRQGRDGERTELRVVSSQDKVASSET